MIARTYTYDFLTQGIKVALCGAFLLSLPINGNILDNVAQPDYNGNPALSLEIVKTPINEGASLRHSFLAKLKEVFNPDEFFETGTYYGQTTIEAARIFKKVYTVELSPKLYTKCVKSLMPFSNVYVFLDESPNFLKQVLPQSKGGKIFWLDAHYSTGITARGKKDTPILEELEAIKSRGVQDGIIMIDDMRYCYAPGRAFPSFTEICNAVLAVNPSYHLALLGDVLLAYPANLNVSVSPFMWASIVSRLYDEDSTLPIDIKKVDALIAQMPDKELEAVTWLREYLGQEEQHGVCHGSFHWWYGLALLYRKNYAEAFKALGVALASQAKKERVPFILSFAELMSQTCKQGECQ
jgi:hypothetical protein